MTVHDHPLCLTDVRSPISTNIVTAFRTTACRLTKADGIVNHELIMIPQLSLIIGI